MLAHQQGGLLNAAQLARGLVDQEAILGHPVAGASWEDVVVENILAIVAGRAEASFYRTSGGAELEPKHSYIACPGAERYRVGPETGVTDQASLCAEVASDPGGHAR